MDNNGGIDGKYESMVKSYGRIQDFSAVENIERNNNKDDKEAYESKYTEDDLALLDTEADRRMEELERLREMQERLRKSAEKGEAMNHDTVSLPSLDEHERSPEASNGARKHWRNWTRLLPKRGRRAEKDWNLHRIILTHPFTDR